MAYSKEQKEDILSRFHASGMSMRAACKYFDDFPHYQTLAGFISEEEAGLLCPCVLDVPGKCVEHKHWQTYPLKTKQEALKLLAGGIEARFVAKRLGISSIAVIRTWATKLGRLDKLDARSHCESVREEVIALYECGLDKTDIAKQVNVHIRTVSRWLDRAGVDKRPYKRRGVTKPVDNEDNEQDKAPLSSDETLEGTEGQWTRAWGTRPDDDPVERARLAEVRLAEALAVLDVLKAPGPHSLSNTEKHQAGQRAQKMTQKIKISDVLRDFRIAKSTYFSQPTIARKKDKYAALRIRVKAIFERSYHRYGSLSIWAALRQGPGTPVSASELLAGDDKTPVIVSEKIIRKIMREENLVAVQVKNARRKYNSYGGEVDERPENFPLCDDGSHNFHSSAPGRLVVTDVTEFKLDGYKVYLSPLIDCYDGCPIAWRVSTHPDDDLTAGSLEDALEFLKQGAIIHTDGGVNYRSNRWKELCEDNGLVRSMSRKAKSPDNARAEGFFGTLKQEFFYARNWKGVTKGCFTRALNNYIVWYRDEKIKKGLDWKTIAAHRAALEDTA